MISVEEAYNRIGTLRKVWTTERIPFLQSANRVLAEDIVADRDFPPYHRVTMDGIAIQSQSFENGQRQFLVEQTAAAGAPPTKLADVKNGVEVMTGAVLPEGTNVVIPYEQIILAGNIATVSVEMVKQFQNVHRQGTDEQKGSVLIKKNTRIAPAHISVMATVGKTEVEVLRLPSVAICSTGDELVPATATPLPHQIRQSNVYFLAADLAQQGIHTSLHHLPDNEEMMLQQLQAIVDANDIVLLSGAVSKGKFDFLPSVLNKLGMETVFHRIAQKPGKPFLLGTIGDKLIAGFPGNPLSTFVCYHLYFKHWLARSTHQQVETIPALLYADVAVIASLANHILVKLRVENGHLYAEAIQQSNSGDLTALLSADGIVTLPAGKTLYPKGEVVNVTRCR